MAGKRLKTGQPESQPAFIVMTPLLAMAIQTLGSLTDTDWKTRQAAANLARQCLMNMGPTALCFQAFDDRPVNPIEVSKSDLALALLP